MKVELILMILFFLIIAFLGLALAVIDYAEARARLSYYAPHYPIPYGKSGVALNIPQDTKAFQTQLWNQCARTGINTWCE